VSQGLQVWDADGNMTMDIGGRYGRVLDIFQPNIGSGSRTYSEIPEDSLDFCYFQGDFQVLTVWKSGQTINWKLDNNFYAGGFSGSRLLIVVAY